MIKKSTAVLFLCLISAFMLEKLVALQSHTLASQQSWYSYKKLSSSYFAGFMGADEFLFERQSLAGEKLNLAVWFGYQDVLYKKPLPDFKDFKIDFNLESEQSYLHIYLNCDQEKCWTFRASANTNYPTGLFLISNEGEYLRRIDLGSTASIGSGRHSFSIKHLQQNFEIHIDDIPYSKFEYAFEHKPIRLRAGYHPVSVSNISYTDIGDKAHSIDFKTTFSIKIMLIGFLVYLLFSFSILWILRRKSNVWNFTYTSLSVLFVINLLFYTFDKFYWSHLYVIDKPNPSHDKSFDFIKKIEAFRKQLFIDQNHVRSQLDFLNQHIWYNDFQRLQQKDMGIGINDFQIIDSDGNTVFKKEIDSYLKEIKNSKDLKIAFVGGSQTWGTGATQLNKTWPALIVKKLAKQTNKKVMAINFSICGGVLYNFIQRAQLMNEFNPDLLILNFGANDLVTPDEHFKFQLKELSHKIDLKKNNVLLSIEASSHEESNEETPKSTLIREFATQNELPLVSLHGHFKSPNVVDSGNMWHDHLHFTDFGHAQASGFFTKTDAYKKLMGNLNKSTGN